MAGLAGGVVAVEESGPESVESRDAVSGPLRDQTENESVIESGTSLSKSSENHLNVS